MGSAQIGPKQAFLLQVVCSFCLVGASFSDSERAFSLQIDLLNALTSAAISLQIDLLNALTSAAIAVLPAMAALGC